MKLLSTLLLCALCYIILTSGACAKKQERTDCPPNTPCTMMFASVSVNITDEKGEPVTFSEIYTLRKSTGEILTYMHPAIEHSYIVVDDSYQKNLVNQTDTFQLIGKKDGEIIMNEPFVINADCCHINKLSGKSEIILP